MLTIGLSAQNTRVVYEYTFKSDSTSTDSLKKEWMYLDINKDGSKFYSKRKFENDSIRTESIRKQLALNSRNLSLKTSSSSGDVSYSVEKLAPDFKTYITTSIDQDNYRVLEDRKIVWKILPEDDKIENYKVQKATTEFAGRKWTAWFASEIPLQDGPYKFYGLPGLILKMEDASGTHLYVMKGLKKFTPVVTEELKTDRLPFLNKKPIDVSRKQYISQLEKFKKDPVQGMREMLNRPNSKVTLDINGQVYTDPKDILREMEKTELKEMSKDNNQIELKP